MNRILIPEKGFHELQRDENTGLWYVRAYRDGKQCYKSTGERKSLRIAWKKGRDILSDFFGTDQDASNVRVKDVAEEIRKEKAKKSKSTLATFGYIVDGHLLPAFGNLKIGELTEKHWLEYVAAEREKGPRKLAHDWRYFREITRRAHEDGFIHRKLRVENPDPENEEGREYTDDELKRLRECATPNLRLQIEMAVTMGMRRGEILGLKWDWVDLERGEIMLPARSTKTRRSRAVAINTAEVLPELKRRRLAARGPYVFPSRDQRTNAETPERPQRDNKTAWQACKERAKVQGHFHWLRHTCASRLMRAGRDIAEVGFFLGMSDEILKRVYWHLSHADRKNLANLITLPKAENFLERDFSRAKNATVRNLYEE